MKNGLICVLGRDYAIKTVPYGDDPLFAKEDVHGYCNTLLHEIVLCDYETHPDWKDTSEDEKKIGTAQLIRHEVIHAFLAESGLQNMAHSGWADDEEIVDWIAIQFPKICEALEILGCGR